MNRRREDHPSLRKRSPIAKEELKETLGLLRENATDKGIVIRIRKEKKKEWVHIPKGIKKIRKENIKEKHKNKT